MRRILKPRILPVLLSSLGVEVVVFALEPVGGRRYGSVTVASAAVVAGRGDDRPASSSSNC